VTEKNLKAFFILLILFLIDLLKPFGYSLFTEFTFLGIIFIAINFPLRTALVFSIIFGYLKDAASATNASFSIFEFTLITILVNYFLQNFRKRAARFFIFYGAIIIHLIANSIYIHKTQYTFSILFIIHSSVIFFLLNYLLPPWLKIHQTKNEQF
jgi:cell shape-determining protein MreD